MSGVDPVINIKGSFSPARRSVEASMLVRSTGASGYM